MPSSHTAVEEAGRFLAERIQHAGGHALAVGGWVRDHFAGYDSKDLDLEVYGLPIKKLEALLRNICTLDVYGLEFGVLRARIPQLQHPIDLVLPRRDIWTGQGHRGFKAELDPWMEPKEAALRRDLTINAVSLDLLKNELVDPWHGLEDLRQRRLQAVDPSRFAEDPLRLLRAAQFAARFELKPTPGMLEICKPISLDLLTAPRIRGEFQKILMLGKKPSFGLRFLAQTGHWSFFCEGLPNLEALDQAVKYKKGNPQEDLIFMLAVLLACVPQPEPFLNQYFHEKSILPRVMNLLEAKKTVEYGTDRSIRRLSMHVSLELLSRLLLAEGKEAQARFLTEQATRLDVLEKPLQPLILGRHLLEAGIPRGPRIKEYLALAFEAQLDGAFSNLKDGLQFLNLKEGNKNVSV